MATDPVTFLIKSTILDRERLLTLAPDYLSFDDIELASAEPTTFTKADIESYRISVDWIYGYRFIIGRSYRIEVRNHEGHIIRIRLRSVFSIRKNILAEKHKNIYRALQDAYFNDMALHYIGLLQNNLAFKLSDVLLEPDGIRDPKIGRLGWNAFGLKVYNTYFAVYDKADPTKYRAFDYGIDWNAILLYSVLDYVAKREAERVGPGGG